jgi:hypothetical protein
MGWPDGYNKTIWTAYTMLKSGEEYKPLPMAA